VTANAYNLLRDRSSYLFPCLIWIDSICINQDNISEKTEQVRLMGDIYTRASLVTVWLSTSAPRQSDMDEITDNFQATLALFQIRRFNSIEASLSNNVSQFASIASEREKPSWEAVSKLLDHPYFERSWIIQEVVLASCIRVMYRRVEIDWEIFASGLLRMGQGNIYTGVALRTADAEISPKLKRMGTLGQIEKWRRKRLRGDEISFSDIALGIKSFQATDLRDKIFAVHGICGTVSEDLTVPDYSKKLSDVYLDATRRLIKEEGISRILFLEGVGYSLEATSGLENFPSWAPD
jgi:Heterokaryon incompatibility protein (HET)